MKTGLTPGANRHIDLWTCVLLLWIEGQTTLIAQQSEDQISARDHRDGSRGGDTQCLGAEPPPRFLHKTSFHQSFALTMSL